MTVVVVCVFAATMDVKFEIAVVDPNLFDAFTRIRSSRPTSDERTPYVVPVAPTMSTQLLPFASQTCHWCVKETAPVHVPLLAVSVSPTAAVPEIVGRLLFTGAVASATTPEPFVPADALPSAFVAVTTASSVWPTSSFCTVYDWDVAPTIGTQFCRSPVASQRCHWYV